MSVGTLKIDLSYNRSNLTMSLMAVYVLIVLSASISLPVLAWRGSWFSKILFSMIAVAGIGVFILIPALDWLVNVKGTVFFAARALISYLAFYLILAGLLLMPHNAVPVTGDSDRIAYFISGTSIILGLFIISVLLSGLVKIKPAYRIKDSSFIISDQSLETVCHHEAGHAMMLALLPEIPPSTRLFVMMRHGMGILGSMTRMRDKNPIPSKTSLEWEMMCSLSGAVAEEVMTGERRPYSASDLSSWQNTARLYFSNGFAGMYYVSPQNEPEQNYNAGVIADLKAHQESVIKAFLEDNKGTLAKISSELFDKPVLTAESLSGFLMDVRIHEGLPRLSNKTFEEAFSPKKTIINYLIDTPD